MSDADPLGSKGRPRVRKALGIVGVVAAVVFTAAATALSVASTRSEREMVGVVTARGTVAVVTHDQLGVQGSMVIDRVVVPGDSWIAVYTEGMGGMPGLRAGLVRVPAGQSLNVQVPFDADVRLTENAIVVIHADRGVVGRFEYDAERFDASPDKPYWMGGRAVEKKVWVRFFEMGNAFRS